MASEEALKFTEASVSRAQATLHLEPITGRYRLVHETAASNPTRVNGHRHHLRCQVVERKLVAARRESGLGPGDVESDDSAVSPADGEFGDLERTCRCTHR